VSQIEKGLAVMRGLFAFLPHCEALRNIGSPYPDAFFISLFVYFANA
jgi:hypothetical protein